MAEEKGALSALGTPEKRRHDKARPLRIFYMGGAGDSVGSYHYWKRGEDDPRQVSRSYAGQFFEVCRELSARVYALNGWKERSFLRDGGWTLRNEPVPWSGRGGLPHHLGQAGYAVFMLLLAVRHRADLAVVSVATDWFALALFRLAGIPVVPAIHCVMWPKFAPPQGRLTRLVQRLNGWFFSRLPLAILIASDEIARQIHSLTAGRGSPPLVEFLPTYEPGTFSAPREAAPPPHPFRVLFVGRIEPDKGVFDVLRMAAELKASGPSDVEVDVCGSGSALERLRAEVRAMGLEDTFRCHGHCLREKMKKMYSDCHVVIVPTTADFVEGFNQVVVEAVLSNRPVIASSVCPALAYVRDAVLEVQPGDVKGYKSAVLRLRDEPDLRDRMARACVRLQAQFLDAGRGWGAGLRHIVRALGTGRPPSPVSWLPPPPPPHPTPAKHP
jgi:glycosyltransferase involved in cell wall biosynthesis